MFRGEIWFGIWPNDPDQKPRPLLIVSNNHRNKASLIRDIIVVKLTSLQRADGSEKPINAAEDVIVQLKKKTIIRCGSIYSVEKLHLRNKVNQLSPHQMNNVDHKLKIALNLH